jgi:hypothetical protein
MPPMTQSPAALIPHPAGAGGPVRSIHARCGPGASPADLEFRYVLAGDAERLRLPPPGGARRSDGLWQHSCFEAFLRPHASDAYYEFNFAPSGDWAAYRFATRRGVRTLPEIDPPRIALERMADGVAVTARVALARLPELARADGIHAGLAAVVEAADGGLSHWALAHGGAKPDFHDPATFLLRLRLA